MKKKCFLFAVALGLTVFLYTPASATLTFDEKWISGVTNFGSMQAEFEDVTGGLKGGVKERQGRSKGVTPEL